VELKGFINTLEAVLASSFLLFLALVAAPQLATDNQLESRETLQQAADTLQSAGELGQNPARVDQSLSGFIPPGLDYRSNVVSYTSNTSRISISGGQRRIPVNSSAGLQETQLFIDSAGPLEVSYIPTGTQPSASQAAGYQGQEDFNNGSFDSTSADRDNNSGDLGIGYLNGTNSDQPNEVGLNNESLVGYWRLDREVSGSNGVLKDYSGLGNDGLTRDGVSTGGEGVFSTDGIQLDGSDDYVDVGRPPELDLSSQRFSEGFTMSAWVKPQEVSDRQAIFTIADGVSGGQWQAYLAYSRNDERRFFFSTRTNGQTDIKSADLYPTNQWYFVTGVWNGQKDILYVNGEKQAEAAIGQPVNTDKNTVHIGRFPGFTHFNGSIDEVRLYNRSLSKSEIEELYFQGRNGGFNGSYRSETFTRSQETDWSALEVDASVPSDTDLTATFETLNRVFSPEQGYSSLSEWNLGTFEATTADKVVLEQNQESELQASTQPNFNTGSFDSTTADREDNSGDLGIGYLNGTRSGQPNDVGLNNESLVGYWRLDRDVSGSGGTVKDYSGYGNNGKTQNGISTGSEGVFSTNSFQSEEGGDIEFVNVSDDTSLDITQEVTMSAWVNLESDASDYWRIVQKGQNTAYEIWVGKGDTYPVLRINNAINLEAPSIQTNNWTLVTATYDTSTDNASIYLDGSLEATTIQDVGNIGTNNNPLRIGTREQKDTSIDGKIDEVRIYNRSLSQLGIEDLYFQGRNGDFNGSYTAEKIDKNQETSWDSLEVNASVPSDTSVNATFRALDTDSSLVAEQDVDLGESLNNYSLSVASSEDAEVVIDGTSSNVTKTWEVHSLEVYSSEVVDRNDGLRIGYRNGSFGDNLVGYYRLDRGVPGAGGTVVDYSGENNGGATKGGVTAGAGGTFSTAAMDFDGNDDYVEIDSSSSNLESWTVSGWIKLDDWSDSARKEWLSVSEDETTAKPLDFVHESGDIKHYRGNAAGEVMSHDVSTEQGWHHMLVTQTRTSDSNVDLAMYFDGSEVDTDSGDYENMRPSLDFSVGRIAGGNPDRFYWTGQVDEIRIYDESLAQSEIDDLYFNGRNGEFNGSYTAEKIDKAQDTSWKKLGVNASVPSQTSVDARFSVLDSQGGLVDSQIISLEDGMRNYSLDVQASKNARLEFNGSSANVTKTWTVHEFNVFSAELQSDGSERFSVGDGQNTFSLGLEPSKLAMIGFNGTTSNVTQTWEVDSFNLLAGDPESGGEEVLLDAAGGESISGFRQLRLPSESGNLSFKGSADISAVIQSYRQNRSSGTPQGTRFSASVFTTKNGTREVTVETWQE
jgi:hypothetical protein